MSLLWGLALALQPWLNFTRPRDILFLFEIFGIFHFKSGTYHFSHILEYRNIPEYSNLNLGHTHMAKIWNIGISQKILFGVLWWEYLKKHLRYTPCRFFWISWNIGILKKKSGTYQKWKKLNIPDFLNIPEYSIFHFRDEGGGVKFNQLL